MTLQIDNNHVSTYALLAILATFLCTIFLGKTFKMLGFFQLLSLLPHISDSAHSFSFHLKYVNVVFSQDISLTTCIQQYKCDTLPITLQAIIIVIFGIFIFCNQSNIGSKKQQAQNMFTFIKLIFFGIIRWLQLPVFVGSMSILCKAQHMNQSTIALSIFGLFLSAIIPFMDIALYWFSYNKGGDPTLCNCYDLIKSKQSTHPLIGRVLQYFIKLSLGFVVVISKIVGLDQIDYIFMLLVVLQFVMLWYCLDYEQKFIKGIRLFFMCSMDILFLVTVGLFMQMNNTFTNKKWDAAFILVMLYVQLIQILIILIYNIRCCSTSNRVSANNLTIISNNGMLSQINEPVDIKKQQVQIKDEFADNKKIQQYVSTDQLKSNLEIMTRKRKLIQKGMQGYYQVHLDKNTQATNTQTSKLQLVGPTRKRQWEKYKGEEGVEEEAEVEEGVKEEDEEVEGEDEGVEGEVEEVEDNSSKKLNKKEQILYDYIDQGSNLSFK